MIWMGRRVSVVDYNIMIPVDFNCGLVCVGLVYFSEH